MIFLFKIKTSEFERLHFTLGTTYATQTQRKVRAVCVFSVFIVRFYSMPQDNEMMTYKWSRFIVLYRAIGIYVLKLDIVPDIINEMNI